MPQMHCNFFSYSLGHGVDLTITLPGVSPCDMDDPALLTHQMPEKFPVLYLLHGHGNDYLSWERLRQPLCGRVPDRSSLGIGRKYPVHGYHLRRKIL